MRNFKINLPKELHGEDSKGWKINQPKIRFALTKNSCIINDKYYDLTTELKGHINKGIEGYQSTILNKIVLVTLFNKKDVL